MKKFFYILALVLLILGACGGDSPDFQQEALDEWNSMTESEQEKTCLGYQILGEDIAERLAKDSKFPEAKVGALLDVFKEKCS